MTQPTYVRFPRDQRDILEAIASEYSVDLAAIIRSATRVFLAEFETATEEQRALMLMDMNKVDGLRSQILAAAQEIGLENALERLTAAARKKSA